MVATETVKGSLSPGRSKPGNIFRAFLASSCVQAYQCPLTEA